MVRGVRPVLSPAGQGRRCAVLGSPIAHSLSPVLHRAAYAELGLAWSYDRVEVREEGLAVTEAPNAATALALLDAGGEFDLVLTDYSMPAMTGRGLAAEVARRWPGLPVAILTGNAEMPGDDATQAAPVLRKPLRPGELAARLREVAAASART